jgi:hypothetical protein
MNVTCQTIPHAPVPYLTRPIPLQSVLSKINRHSVKIPDPHKSPRPPLPMAPLRNRKNAVFYPRQCVHINPGTCPFDKIEPLLALGLSSRRTDV